MKEQMKMLAGLRDLRGAVTRIRDARKDDDVRRLLGILCQVLGCEIMNAGDATKARIHKAFGDVKEWKSRSIRKALQMIYGER